MKNPQWFAVSVGENIYNLIFKLLNWSKKNKRTSMARTKTDNAKVTVTVKPDDSYIRALVRYQRRVRKAKRRKRM